MTRVEYPGDGLRGAYRDVLRDPAGRVVWDGDWQRNSIVADCRRLLATFMRGVPASVGVFGLAVGAGLSQWDDAGPPPATPGQNALVDPTPFILPAASLQMDFLDGATVSGTPTNRLQIQAAFGPGTPPWPGGDHPTGNLREFGLVGRLAGANVLINYVTHLVIAKDPASTLERTIWLTF